MRAVTLHATQFHQLKQKTKQQTYPPTSHQDSEGNVNVGLAAQGLLHMPIQSKEFGAIQIGNSEHMLTSKLPKLCLKAVGVQNIETRNLAETLLKEHLES